jgi:hypothetical protein
VSSRHFDGIGFAAGPNYTSSDALARSGGHKMQHSNASGSPRTALFHARIRSVTRSYFQLARIGQTEGNCRHRKPRVAMGFGPGWHRQGSNFFGCSVCAVPNGGHIKLKRSLCPAMKAGPESRAGCPMATRSISFQIEDGFFCLWDQRVLPDSKQPIGAALVQCALPREPPDCGERLLRRRHTNLCGRGQNCIESGRAYPNILATDLSG